MQALLIVLGLAVIGYGIWRWLGTVSSNPNASGASVASDPEHILFNILFLCFGFAILALGAIMSLG